MKLVRLCACGASLFALAAFGLNAQTAAPACPAQKSCCCEKKAACDAQKPACDKEKSQCDKNKADCKNTVGEKAATATVSK